MEGPLATAAPEACAVTALELALHPDDAAALWRSPALSDWRRGRRVRRTEASIVWHDTEAGTLAAEGLAASEHHLGARVLWRLERHAPGIASPVLVEAPHLAGLIPSLPRAPPDDTALRPLARLDGVVRSLPGEGTGLRAVRVLAGTLQAGKAAVPACRVTLEGPAGDVFATARQLARGVRLTVPVGGLAERAASLAGIAMPARRGAPVLPDEATPDAALAAVLGQLAATLLRWAPLAASGERGDSERGGGEAGEPVHQMRVALRRLRSAMREFERAAGCPSLEAVQAELRALAGALGEARDWDVFLDGLGEAVRARFGAERAVRQMLAAADRQRRARYRDLAALLDGPTFRCLGIALVELAATRIWCAWAPDDPALAARRATALEGPLPAFARHALTRRLRHAIAAGDGFAGRGAEELHRLRIQCKRLRYACELFAPLFPARAGRRFLRRLAMVQERLGLLNDGAVAERLMAALTPARGHALARGLVRGYAAAGEARLRDRAERSWRRFRQCQPFWS